MNRFDDDFIKSIGKNLKYFRLLFGLSQEELASRSNMSTSFYKKIETMQAKNPGIKNIVRICTALNIPMDFLVKDNGIKLFDTYTNTRIFEEISNLPNDEFELLTKSLAFQYELVKKRKKLFEKNNED